MFLCLEAYKNNIRYYNGNYHFFFALIIRPTIIFTIFIRIYLLIHFDTMNQNSYTVYSPACPCCCSAYMVEHETYWVCPVCGAVVDKG